MSKNLELDKILKITSQMRDQLNNDFHNLAMDLEKEIVKKTKVEDVEVVIDNEKLMLKLRIQDMLTEKSLLNHLVQSRDLKISELETLGFSDCVAKLKDNNITKRLKSEHVEQLSEETFSYITESRHLKHYQEFFHGMANEIVEDLDLRSLSKAA